MRNIRKKKIKISDLYNSIIIEYSEENKEKTKKLLNRNY